MKRVFAVLAVFCLLFFSCSKHKEFSSDEFEGFVPEGLAELLAKTVSKPWRGEAFLPGKVGGTWYMVINEDPKSFNHLIAEQDSNTAFVVRNMTDYLTDYDVISREWIPNIASSELIVNDSNNTMQVVYTLRNDIYWSYYNSNQKVKVTSDDVIFWYNEIEGDPASGSSGYNSQFLIMPDGSQARVTISKIDDLRFSFNFPRIIAEPQLSTNMDFGPRHIFEPAKRRGGIEAVKNLFSIAVNPQTIPSMGEWFLVEYTPGQKLVYKRNPDYWRKDSKNVSLPYIEEMVVRIIPEENTKLLLFRRGELDTYGLRPEDIDTIINNNDGSYTVFNSEGSLGANFWTFNQNPVNSGKPQYEWFTKKEFRQAMSCLLHRNRINAQVYRGLAEPKIDFFAEPNPFYNPSIKLEYLYNVERALDLLSSIGIKRDANGTMRDSKNNAVEFDLTIRSESTVYQDISSIIMDTLSQIGIKVNIRVLDFQKQVQQVFETYDWDSMLIGLSGSNYFPTQGSNVWPSDGNYHMWYPNQKTPATDWEARIDYLYNEGKFTIDNERAKVLWDEFQSIILEQCPLIYLMRPRGFWALNNRWDFTNVYYDNLKGSEISHIYIK